MNLEKDLNEILRGLSKSKSRVKSRNELKEHIRARPSELVNIFTTSDTVSWKQLITFVIEHELREIDSCLNKQVSSFMKIQPLLSDILTLQFSNGNFSYIKITINHITDQLLSKNESTLRFIGLEYLYILGSVIIDNHAIRCHLTQDKWNVIYTCVCSLLADCPSFLQIEVSGVFLKTIDFGYQHSTLPSYLVFNSLYIALCRFKDTHLSPFITILSAFNLAAERIGVNCIALVCRVGDNILESMVSYLTNGSFDVNTEHCCKFIMIQIEFHHPSDLIQTEYITECWINSVLRLYHLLLEKYQAQKDFFKSISPSTLLENKEYDNVQNLFFNMLVQVMRSYQLITNYSPNSLSLLIASQPKKIKLTSSSFIEQIYEYLSNCYMPRVVINIHFLNYLLDSFPCLFKGRVVSTVQLIFEIIHTSTTEDTIYYVVNEVILCLTHIVANKKLYEEQDVKNSLTKNILLYNVHLQKQISSYYKLLSLILVSDNQTELPLFWNNLLQNVCIAVDSNCIEFLWNYLSIRDLPFNKDISTVNNTVVIDEIPENSLPRHSTRISLINSLLSCKKDNVKSYVNWLNCCDQFFMLGQILAAQCMRSCKKSLLLTQKFFTDSKLRKIGLLNTEEEFLSSQSVNLMLEFEFLPISSISAPDNFTLFTSDKYLIPKCNTEYIAYTLNSFSAVLSQLTGNGHNLKILSCAFLSLLKFYFYFHLNLVIWSSFQTNTLVVPLQIEFISLVFNQCTEDTNQLSPNDVLSSICKLNEFLFELRSIMTCCDHGQSFKPAVNSAITSLLNCIPNNLIDSIKCIVLTSIEDSQTNQSLRQNVDPFISSDQSRTAITTSMQLLCCLHWLYFELSSEAHNTTEDFLVNTLSRPIDVPLIQCTLSLHANFTICVYFAGSSMLICSEANLSLILECLLNTCSQLCKFNQYALSKIMHILQSLASKIVKSIHVNTTITHHMENLIRILSSTYMNFRFSSPNRARFIKLIFHIHGVFSDLDWPTFTIQTDNCEQSVQTTLKELIYQLNIDIERDCISCQAKSLALLHEGSVKPIYSKLHFHSFRDMIDAIWESDHSAFLSQNLIPSEFSECVSTERIKTVLLFYVKMVAFSYSRSSLLVAQILNFSITKGIDSGIIIRALTRIVNDYCYQDLLAYFVANYESILIEWRCLNNSLCTFPFELFGMTELEYVENYATKCVHIILLTSDIDGMGFLVKSLPQVESNTDLIKLCFIHNLFILLLTTGEQIPIHGLNELSPNIHLTEARDYLLKHLSLEFRRKIIKNNIESTILSLFTKYIGSCSEERLQCIKGMLPPVFIIDIDKSCLEDMFSQMFGISLISCFKENNFLLPRLHTSLLKYLYASVQPNLFIFNLHCYMTFLQFIAMNACSNTKLFIFLLSDPVYVLLELLSEDDRINTDLHRLNNKFSDTVTHEDTCTILQTLIGIYKLGIQCVPDLVRYSVSILNDVLCSHAQSVIPRISNLALNYLKEFVVNILFKYFHAKYVALLIFIPSIPVLEELADLLSVNLKRIHCIEVLQELAVSTWYTHMSCVTYLNQVKLYLKLNQDIMADVDTCKLNSLLNKLVQNIQLVSTSSSTPKKLSELVYEIFSLLTPHYSQHKLSIGCRILPIYIKPFNLNANLYHFPILLSRLSQLIHSTDIQLKESAYDTFYSISDAQSLLTIVSSLKQSSESSSIPIIFTSYLLKTKKVSKHRNPKLSNLPIPFRVPSENSLDLTIIWLRELCLFIIGNYIKDPILVSTKIFIEISEICTRDFLKMYIYSVILEGDVEKISNISQHFNDGLKQAFDFLLTNSTETQVNEHSIRIIMEVIHFLRRRVLFVERNRSFQDNFLLDINYLYLACSTFLCRDYHSTLLYLHIYTDPLCSEFSHQHSVPNDHQVIPRLLINTYGKLGEIGCVNSVACDSLYLEFQKAKSIGNWPEVMQMCSTFPFNQVGGSQDLSEAIFQMGWYSMLLQQSNTISDIRFESAWRLGLWDDKLPDVDSDSCEQPFSQQIIYEGIQAFKDRDISYVSTCVKSCHTSTLEELLSSTEGSIIDIYNLLSNISISQTLIQFSSFAELVLTNKIQSNEFQSQTQMLPTKESLKDILSIRVSLLLRLVTFLETDRFTDQDTFVRLFELILNDVTTAAKLARKSNHCSDANNLLHTLKLKLQTLDILPEKFRRKLLIQINLEFAKVKYLQKDFQTSFSLLESTKDNCNEFPKLYCYLLTLYGNYLGEKQRETSSNVISQFLERSVNVLRELGNDVSSTSQVKLLEKAHNSLAQYTDNQYNMIVDYLISPEYKLKVELAHALTHMSSLSLDNCTAVTMDIQRNAKKHAEEYRKQSIEFEKDKIEFLKTSLKSYCFCLKLSNTNDMSISRVISLWFDNSDNHDISTMLADHLRSISSYKFIPWVYQIIPRLCFIPSEVNNPFSETLRNLVLRMTTEHPYHCLPLLFAIFHSPLDAYFAEKHTYASFDLSRQFQNEDTNSQCKNILETTRSVLKDTILDRMETIYIDLIDLAHHNPNDICTMSIPKKCTLLRESNIRDLPMFSIDVPISPNADYTNVVTIVRFEPTYTFPGGITKPKLLTCLGSDGNRYKMLLKGREDLRKDAVIQQGFGLINQLLAQDAWFVEKGVRIRTYKIVPLSQSSGLISFCEGTMSLAEYLIHKNGAHHRYYPNEPDSENFEYEMRSARFESQQAIIQTYLLICEQFHPVFRFFFLEMFNDASTWFQRRMQYTRSVAVASMAGYIFGIGDRHPENIRIDTSSAEIVHIDFGELFDSGKHLKVPELVPFRLTRDMVDPMGDLGKEGVFRPCCEETLRIIRQSKENIKTIIKVLLHTPLHKWKILQNCVKSSLSKQQVQDNDNNMSPTGNRANLSIHGEDTNELALRVLLRINEKIDGIEGRTPLSIAGQVNRLIAEATDRVNLGSMYYGWKSWI